jgi:carbonic anhydrase/acetyltransferase-like protein (isoleucine patch superfamily)
MSGTIPFKNKNPKIHDGSYISPFALVSGEVVIEEDVSIWPCAVIRADEGPIILRRSSAVLEHALIEAPEGHPTEIGEKALVSHGAILHGCKVGARSLIGIGAIVLDGALIEEECIIGAGAVLPPSIKVPKRTLMLGIPAKPVREVREKEVQMTLNKLQKIKSKAKEYRNELKKVERTLKIKEMVERSRLQEESL